MPLGRAKMSEGFHTLLNGSDAVQRTDSMAASVHFERIPPRYGMSAVLASMVFFQILNKLVGTPKSIETEVWKWKNLFISWVHAVIIGVWDLTCFYRNPEMMSDLIEHHTLYSFAMIAFSTGYFLYDFIDIIINKKIVKFWEVLIHHIAVGGMFFYNVIQCQCIAYNVVALLAEINTIFLHTRKLLQMCQVEYTHWLYRINSYVNLVTFIIFRFGALVAIAYGLYEWGHRVTVTYFVLLSSSCIIMTVINSVLFWRLFKSDMLRIRGVVTNNNNEKTASNGKQKTH